MERNQKYKSSMNRKDKFFIGYITVWLILIVVFCVLKTEIILFLNPCYLLALWILMGVKKFKKWVNEK